MPALYTSSHWIATYDILPDGKVQATITDNNGMHVSENHIFESLDKLKEYMASK